MYGELYIKGTVAKINDPISRSHAECSLRSGGNILKLNLANSIHAVNYPIETTFFLLSLPRDNVKKDEIEIKINIRKSCFTADGYNVYHSNLTCIFYILHMREMAR